MKKNYALMVLIALFAIANVGFADQTVKLKVQVPDSTKVVYATGGFNGWNPEPDVISLSGTFPKNFNGTLFFK